MLNREIVTQHAIRINAKEKLLTSLKTLNKTIEQFAHLRGLFFLKCETSP